MLHTERIMLNLDIKERGIGLETSKLKGAEENPDADSNSVRKQKALA